MSSYTMTVHRKTYRKKEKLRAAGFISAVMISAFFGLVLGVMSKVWDGQQGLLGSVFSQLSVWYVICRALAAYSPSPMQAAAKVSVFCPFMLAGYYLTAEMLGMYYKLYIAKGWFLFCLPLPVCAALVWYAKGNGKMARPLKAGIIACRVISQTVLYGVSAVDIVLWRRLFVILK